MITYSHQLYAVDLIDNGDFESSQLAPWIDASKNFGRVDLLDEGACLADTDTRAIQIHGEKAVVLHAEDGKSPGVHSLLRSDIFTAGNGVAFIALSAWLANAPESRDLKLQINLIDADSGNTLVSQVFSPSGIRLEAGCSGQALPEHTEAQPFSSHYFSTQAYSGQSIRLQFQVAAGEHAPSAFILLDQVAIFSSEDQALFYSKPYAQAGMRRSSTGTIYLSAQGSFDPDQQPSPLAYSWYVDNKLYRTANPCLTNFDRGNYRAVLYVNDGHNAISDLTHFYLDKRTSVRNKIQEKECIFMQQSKLENSQTINAVREALLLWARAWSERDAGQYIRAYGPDYAPPGKRYPDWAEERRLNFRRKDYIKITLSEIHIEPHSEQYRARFTQRYESNRYRDTVYKELIFALQNNRWTIVSESTL